MTHLPEDLRWQIEESDRLRPFGQDPVDDALEQHALVQASRDRGLDHTPAPRHAPTLAPPLVPVAEPSPVNPDGPRRRRAPWTVCQCGAWEKGYRHPGHRYGCRRYAKHNEPQAA